MKKGMMKGLILLITYTVVLVAVIVEMDAVGGWVQRLLSAFAPLYIGFAIAFVLNRPCAFFARQYGKVMKKKAAKLCRPLAVLTAYLLFLAAVAAVGALVVPELVKSIETFVNNLGTYAANLQSLYDSIVQRLDLDALAGLNLSTAINEALGRLLSTVLSALTTTLPQLITVTGEVISGLVTMVLAMVFSVYMLSGGPRLVGQIRRLANNYLPKKVVGPTLSVARLTADTFTNFVSGQLTEACILGVLCFLGMSIFRFSYAPLISVIIAVSALIPVAGAYVGAIVSAVLLVMISPIQALWFLVFLVVLQQLEGNLIYPRVVGTSIGLPGIWVLAAVAVGGSLLGFLGMVVGVPLTAVLYTLLKRDLHRREGGDATPPEPPAQEPSAKA